MAKFAKLWLVICCSLLFFSCVFLLGLECVRVKVILTQISVILLVSDKKVSILFHCISILLRAEGGISLKCFVQLADL